MLTPQTRPARPSQDCLMFDDSSYSRPVMEEGTRVENSLRKGISFGLTSAVITTLGLMVGLNSGDAFKDCGPCRDSDHRHCRCILRCVGYSRFRGSGEHSHRQANLGGHRRNVPDEVHVRNDLRGPCRSSFPLHGYRREFDMGNVHTHCSELRHRKIARSAGLEDRRRTPDDRNRRDCSHALGGQPDWNTWRMNRHLSIGCTATSLSAPSTLTLARGL